MQKLRDPSPALAEGSVGQLEQSPRLKRLCALSWEILGAPSISIPFLFSNVGVNGGGCEG